MRNQTTLKLSSEDLERLLDALEGTHTHLLDEDELATHERLIKRLSRALDRLG